MSYTLAVIFTFSIAIAAVIGLFRYKKINPVHYPFIYCIWIGFLNEVISYILAHTVHNNMPASNIYVLTESLLITWQFRNWGVFKRFPSLYYIIFSLFSGVWIAENIFISNITHVNFYFKIFYSFIVVLMSIHAINGLIVWERKVIFKNPVFLICIGFLFYYTLIVLVQASWLYGTSLSREFRLNIIYVMIYVNLFANLIYALAILWMPSKQRFSMPS